ncbi:hypothetical protein PFISCL1PPCAC_390, partial [Pristionchus fissidentatus]
VLLSHRKIMIIQFLLLFVLAMDALALNGTALNGTIPCNSSSVAVNSSCVKGKTCPIVTLENITCPDGAQLRGTNGTLNAATCDTATGNYTNVTGEVHCEIVLANSTSPTPQKFTCNPTSVKVKCVDKNICPNVTASGISCPAGALLKGTSVNATTCDTTTGKYTNVTGEIYCEKYVPCSPLSMKVKCY